MKYKMLVLDMDGTLLTNEKTITERSRRALKAAEEKGVKIVIATGRIFASALVYGEMLGVSTPIIASNGAYIKEKDRDEVIYAKELGAENLKEVIRMTHEHGLYCHVFTWDTIFTEKLIYSAFNYSKWNKSLPEDKRIKINVIARDDWDKVIEENKNSILKAIVTDDDLERVIALRKDVSRLDVEVESSYPNNFEVMNKEVSKGKAAAILAKYYNLTREEVICIGDNENDASMIEYAGLGVAMENASDEAKRVADFITLSNEEDGVAHVIEKFILNN